MPYHTTDSLVTIKHQENLTLSLHPTYTYPNP